MSPIDGEIGKLLTNKIGTLVSSDANRPFVTLINKHSLYVEAQIEE